MLRTSISPTIIDGGYRVNVIPSEVTATLDIRLLPDEDPEAFVADVRRVIANPAIEVAWAPRDIRPAGVTAIDTEAFRSLAANFTRHYATTLPVMSGGATDISYLRARGMQCYGIGPATDVEDGPRGFGAHSDQERILEAELQRFVRFNLDVVAELAARR